MNYYEEYLDYIYNLVKSESKNLDAIYSDYIVMLVGTHGFDALHENKLIESCGVGNGRFLFVLCDKKGKIFGKEKTH